MLDMRRIYPLTDFLRNHKAHLRRIRRTRTPEILTVNGKAELVIIDPDSYQDLQEELQHMQTVAAIREGIAAAERGELKPARKVLAEMKVKCGLQSKAQRAR